MSPRTRLSLWLLAVLGTLFSPILFRVVAPWLGAAWQCVCLGGMLALYATTPANAIRLPAWISKALIVGGMAAFPALCYGRVTWALVVAPLVVFVFDHVPLTFSWPGGNKGVHITARWSWKPGVASDWLAAVQLWSPATWLFLAGMTDPAAPAWAMTASFYGLMFMFLLQMPDRPRPGVKYRISGRVGMVMVFMAINVLVVVGLARSPDV